MFLPRLSDVLENRLAEPLEGASFTLSLFVVSMDSPPNKDDFSEEFVIRMERAIRPYLAEKIIEAANEGKDKFKFNMPFGGPRFFGEWHILADVTGIIPA